MPPEAMEDKPEEEGEDEKSRARYGASIDVFSFGVVAIFTLSQIFPDKLRRERYTRKIYKQLRQKHPLLMMIEGCLDFPEDRPSIGRVLRLLEEAGTEVRDKHTDMNKLELLKTLHVQRRSDQKLRRELADTQTSLADAMTQLQLKDAQLEQQLREKDVQVGRLQQQLREKDAQNTRNEERHRQQLAEAHGDLEQTRAQLREKEARLIRAEETIRRQHQQLEHTEGQLQSREVLGQQQRLVPSRET